MIDLISPTASRNLRTVNVKINSEYSDRLMEFLVHSKIPFSVQFVDLEPSVQENPLPITPLIPPKENPIALKSSKKGVGLSEQIYNRYIKNVNPDGIPKLSEIAAEFCVSEATVKSAIKKTYGKTFYQLHMECKMKHAAKLMLQGYQANVVSRMIGYSNNSSIKFNKMFQKYFGITPKKYQMSNAN
jgi:AraC-like DNA-binding protein